MNDKKRFIIDASNGDIYFPNNLKIFKDMSKEQLMTLDGVKKNSELKEMEWYWFPEIKDEMGVLHTTPTTEKAIISHVGLAYNYSSLKSTHELHCNILKDNFKEMAPTSFIKDKDVPSMPLYPEWVFNWGKVIAAYNHRWEFFEISVTYI